eukprot:3937087-Amphidinium_carterae.1
MDVPCSPCSLARTKKDIRGGCRRLGLLQDDLSPRFKHCLAHGGSISDEGFVFVPHQDDVENPQLEPGMSSQ